jgi:phospholipid/cholesterol/gamma-HCH transport system permease protein
VAGWQVYMAVLPSAEFIDGAQRDFIPFHIAYAFIKTLIFAMLLATIPSFHGYYMKGGALEVGKQEVPLPLFGLQFVSYLITY